jgi:hypothetical protein
MAVILKAVRSRVMTKSPAMLIWCHNLTVLEMLLALCENEPAVIDFRL